MNARVLVTGAGTAAAENLMASLRVAAPSIALVGCGDDRFALRHSRAPRKYLVPRPARPDFLPALQRLVRTEAIDLVVPTSDVQVLALSRARRRLAGRLFLPGPGIVGLCRDKHRLAQWLGRRGVPVPRTRAVSGLAALDRVFGSLGGGRLWCRPRTGTCARGGAAVASPAQARAWIEIWNQLQGVPVRAFTLSEYLPGREILCQSLWDRGRLVLAGTFERLAYFGADNLPSGVTSLSSLAKTVRAPAVVELCRRAVRAVSPRASGAFSIDVKEDATGRPRVTEINAGRFFMAMTAFDAVLKHSMVLTYVRLGLGEHVVLPEPYDAAEDVYMVRDLDLEPGIYHGTDLFEGIAEA